MADIKELLLVQPAFACTLKCICKILLMGILSFPKLQKEEYKQNTFLKKPTLVWSSLFLGVNDCLCQPGSPDETVSAVNNFSHMMERRLNVQSIKSLLDYNQVTFPSN